MKCRSIRGFMSFMLVIALVSSGMHLLAFTSSGDTYLAPTADPAWHTTMSGYLLAFPIGGAGQLAFPISKRMTASICGGAFGYPAGFIGSAYLRMHLVHPDSRRWGVAAQALSGMAVAFSGGEGNGGIVSGIAIAASSPIKPTRIGLGAALHTMPGSEFKPGWQESRNYDFRNPQPTFFVSGGHAFRKSTLFTEVLWIAPGADGGWDSAVAGIIGGEFSIARAKLKLATGIFIQKPGTVNPRTLPIPPIAALAIPL